LGKTANIKGVLNSNNDFRKIGVVQNTTMKGDYWTLEILLNKEETPIIFNANVNIVGVTSLTVRDITTNKEWLNGIVDAVKKQIPYIAGKKGLFKYRITLGGENMGENKNAKNPIVSKGKEMADNKIAENLSVSMKGPGKAKLEILLKGESSPVNVSLNYGFQKGRLTITGVSSNKEWVNGIAELLKDSYSSIPLKKVGMIEGIIKHLM